MQSLFEGPDAVVSKKCLKVVSPCFTNAGFAPAALRQKNTRPVHETGVEPEKIADYIGKEPAKRLLEEVRNYGSVEGDTSQWTVGYQSVARGPGEEAGYIVYDPNGHIWRGRDSKPEVFSSEREAKKFIEEMVTQDKMAQGLPKISGLDLKVGGEWAKALYDRAIPNFLSKYARKWNAKVETTHITSGNSVSIEYDAKYAKEPWHVVQDGPDGRKLLGTWKSEAAAKTFLNDRQKAETIPVHSISITPEMRKSILKTGQPIAKTSPKEFDWATGVKQLAT